MPQQITQEYDLQIIVASGPADPKRAVLGLAMAASAASCGRRVQIYFAMDGAQFLLSENCSRIVVDGFPSVSDLVEVVYESGGAILYCPNCLQGQCAPALKPKIVEYSVCHLAKPGGMSAVGMQLGVIPTVVF